MTKLDFGRAAGGGGANAVTGWGDVGVGDVKQRVKFGVSLNYSFGAGDVPESLVALFRRLCHEGVNAINIFRKPGNHGDIEKMRRKLQEGKPVDLDKFAIHTVASVVKSFISQIPDGLFGDQGERRLLVVMETKDLTDQYETISQVLHSLSTPSQHLAILLFGTLSRTLSHAQENGMTAESLAVSIAPSVITTCTKQPLQIKNAVNLLKLLIQSFPLQRIFGTANISYFSAVMGTTIRVTEWFKYDFNGPQSSAKLRPSRKQKVIRSILDAESKDHGFHVNRHSVSSDDFPGIPSPTSPEGDENDDDARRRTSAIVGPATVVKETENGGEEVVTIPMEQLLEMNRHHEQTRNATRFSEVRERQLRRLRTRTDWILQSEVAAEAKEQKKTVALRRTKSGREASEPPMSKNADRNSSAAKFTTGSNSTKEPNECRYFRLVTEFISNN